MAQIMFFLCKTTYMTRCCLLFIVLFSFQAKAQQDSLIYSYEAHLDDTEVVEVPDTIVPGSVKYFYPAAIDSLILFQNNENAKNCPKTVRGFRVQIYSCTGSQCREKAQKTLNQFIIAHPDIPAEIIWEPPSQKIRVGNCRNRFEAEQIKSKIKEDFPFIFIVPNDFIDSPYKIKCKSLE